MTQGKVADVQLAASDVLESTCGKLYQPTGVCSRPQTYILKFRMSSFQHRSQQHCFQHLRSETMQ
jgi:hypothetical protein